MIELGGRKIQKRMLISNVIVLCKCVSQTADGIRPSLAHMRFKGEFI